MRRLRIRAYKILFILGMATSLLPPVIARADEYEITRGQKSPISGVVMDEDTYRKVVSDDVYNVEYQKWCQEKVLELQTESRSDHSNNNTFHKVVLGFAIGILTASIVK